MDSVLSSSTLNSKQCGFFFDLKASTSTPEAAGLGIAGDLHSTADSPTGTWQAEVLEAAPPYQRITKTPQLMVFNIGQSASYGCHSTKHTFGSQPDAVASSAGNNTDSMML